MKLCSQYSIYYSFYRENYKLQLDKIQDGLLGFLNQNEIDMGQLAMLLKEYATMAKLIAGKLKYYAEDSQQDIPKEFQESVIQLAHIKNITYILRQKISL